MGPTSPNSSGMELDEDSGNTPEEAESSHKRSREDTDDGARTLKVVKSEEAASRVRLPGPSAASTARVTMCTSSTSSTSGVLWCCCLLLKSML